MNLISNCCIGGDYYKVLNKEYDNPFIWVIIKPIDMINHYQARIKNDKKIKDILGF